MVCRRNKRQYIEWCVCVYMWGRERKGNARVSFWPFLIGTLHTRPAKRSQKNIKYISTEWEKGSPPLHSILYWRFPWKNPNKNKQQLCCTAENSSCSFWPGAIHRTIGIKPTSCTTAYSSDEIVIVKINKNWAKEINTFISSASVFLVYPIASNGIGNRQKKKPKKGVFSPVYTKLTTDISCRALLQANRYRISSAKTSTVIQRQITFHISLMYNTRVMITNVLMHIPRLMQVPRLSST